MGDRFMGKAGPTSAVTARCEPAELARLTVTVKKFIPSPGAGPLEIRGRIVWEVLGTVDAELAPAHYLMRVELVSNKHSHPLADVPFTIGAGRWVWLPGDDDEDQDDVIAM